MVNEPNLVQGIEIAYRVTDESAIPLVLPKQTALGGSPVPLDRLNQYEGELVALMLDDRSALFKRVGSALPGDLSHLRQFESIGGLGASLTLAITQPHPGIRLVVQARLIVGVLY